MTPASQRNQVIVFERATETRGALGGKSATSWAAMGTARFAKVLFGSGSERRTAAVESATQAATFRVLADDLAVEVTTQDRIVHRGLAYDITGIAAIGLRPDELEFTATAARG